MSGIDALNKFLQHAAAGDLPLDELLGLKAEAFEACAVDSRNRGDIELAKAEEAAAHHAWNAAASERTRPRHPATRPLTDRELHQVAAAIQTEQPDEGQA